MSALVDTDALINYIRGYEAFVDLLDELSEEEELFISAMTRLEILAGIRRHERVRTLEILEAFTYVGLSDEIVAQAEQYLIDYRAQGITLSVPDSLIAASALVMGLRLVTTNVRHYPMEDIEKWVPPNDTS